MREYQSIFRVVAVYPKNYPANHHITRPGTCCYPISSWFWCRLAASLVPHNPRCLNIFAQVRQHDRCCHIARWHCANKNIYSHGLFDWGDFHCTGTKHIYVGKKRLSTIYSHIFETQFGWIQFQARNLPGWPKKSKKRPSHHESLILWSHQALLWAWLRNYHLTWPGMFYPILDQILDTPTWRPG